uniref:Uncharacterized protein n=1 Tax=Anguilla anguilla TaxID=7936 RepID=A0A0E9VNP2_ANGAN
MIKIHCEHNHIKLYFLTSFPF